MFPRVIGVLLMVGTVAYLSDAFLQFLVPGVADSTAAVLIPVVILAEVSLLLYLLIKGVKTAQSPDKSLAA